MHLSLYIQYLIYGISPRSNFASALRQLTFHFACISWLRVSSRLYNVFRPENYTFMKKALQYGKHLLVERSKPEIQYFQWYTALLRACGNDPACDPDCRRHPRFGESDLGWVELALCMRGAGLPVEAMIEYVKLCQQGDSTIEARMLLLKEQMETLLEQKAPSSGWISRSPAMRKQ